jgi:hypothetical protein
LQVHFSLVENAYSADYGAPSCSQWETPALNNNHPAIAVDWLDAYRAKDLDGVLALYTDDATLECGCGGAKVISGKSALRAYWKDRLAKLPASDLRALERSADGAMVEYRTPDGMVRIAMHFDESGLIARAKCGPIELPAPQARTTEIAGKPVKRPPESDEIVRYRQLAKQCLALAAKVKDPAAAERLKRLAANHMREVERLSQK